MSCACDLVVCRTAGSKSPLVWSKMQEWRAISTNLTVPRSEHCMQVRTQPCSLVHVCLGFQGTLALDNGGRLSHAAQLQKC
jgi:hypothetical protein